MMILEGQDTLSHHHGHHMGSTCATVVAHEAESNDGQDQTTGNSQVKTEGTASVLVIQQKVVVGRSYGSDGSKERHGGPKQAKQVNCERSLAKCSSSGSSSGGGSSSEVETSLEVETTLSEGSGSGPGSSSCSAPGPSPSPGTSSSPATSSGSRSARSTGTACGTESPDSLDSRTSHLAGSDVSVIVAPRSGVTACPGPVFVVSASPDGPMAAAKGSPVAGDEALPLAAGSSASLSSAYSGSSSSGPESELGNKCGKCQNHEIETSKKGHARDCPFKKCNCLKCRLLDARSDILQVISGKETKLKGTKKDPNCGFCQNHGVKILRKGHVRSCGFGQERHFKLENCFDCEVHYIRNEVNRLQIKMRRAMKEDRTLSEEQRKTAREAITRDEVEKVCDMARLARKKRESILTQQQTSGESSSHQPQAPQTGHHLSPSSSACATSNKPKVEHSMTGRHNHNLNQHQLSQLARQTGVWRPWSQHQVAAAIAAQQHQQNQHAHHHHHQQLISGPMNPQLHHPTRRTVQADDQVTLVPAHHHQQHHNNNLQHQLQITNGTNNNSNRQLSSAITSMSVVTNQTYPLINSLAVQRHQQQQQHHQRQQQQQQHQQHHHQQHQQQRQDQLNQRSSLLNDGSHALDESMSPIDTFILSGNINHSSISPPETPPEGSNVVGLGADQPISLTQRNLQEQQLFNTLFRLIVAQFAQPTTR